MNKDEIDKFLNRVVEYFKSRKEVLCVVLFGSYARGDYSPRHSDIDLYLIIDKNKGSLEYELELHEMIHKLAPKISVHLNFEYREMEEDMKKLRYNVFREGKVLFEKKKMYFTMKDLGLEEFLLLRLDLSALQSNEKYNFKKSILTKYKKEVFFYSMGVVVIKKSFWGNFEAIAKRKDIKIKNLGEFIGNY